MHLVSAMLYYVRHTYRVILPLTICAWLCVCWFVHVYKFTYMNKCLKLLF